MWSPKIPLKLPGKKVTIKQQELYSLNYSFDDDDQANALQQNDEEVLFSVNNIHN